ncbi:MAG: hypothetical protein C7B44_00145 [Sulfobacillus thermosulfidooxidans]|nr:MAG: hypothetical protein C7B44_00145 [Sulfobacillus thermosulfidooxidans]
MRNGCRAFVRMRKSWLLLRTQRGDFLNMTWDDERLKQLIKDLVLIESPSFDAEGVERVEQRVVDALDAVGAQCTFHPTPRGPILEVRRGQGGALLLGHADTVWPAGTLKTMPFIDSGGGLAGPGVLDMKAGLAYTAAAISQLPADVPFDWLVTPDEEVGSEVSRSLIEDRAKMASLVLVAEPGAEAGALKIGRAGVGSFLLEIVGIASHAGLDPRQGASAIRELAQQILWLGSLENQVLGTTVNVGVVEGGTRPNVIAGHAKAQIDIRVRTVKEMERMQETLNHPPHFDTRTSIRYVGGFSRPPMDLRPEAAWWFDWAASVWHEMTGQVLAGVNVGGASDGNFTATLAPTLDGLGAVGQGAHALHERMEWDYTMPRIHLLQALITHAALKEERP